ncbi:MAG: hypothetical protein HY704_15060 [Gemmatimonadetes bacterium]|nr:hypothetical protein [Gemmatimonadota bacterium]
MPPAPEFPTAWQLGEPDLVLEFPAYRVPAGGSDIYRNLVAAAPVRETRFVRAVEVRPGDPRVVHHARMMIDTTDSSRRFDAEDAEVGFDGMDIMSDAFNPDGFFIGWTPGKLPLAGSEEMGWRLAPGTDVVLQLHFRPAGERHRVTARVGLYFTSRPPTRFPVVILMGSKLIDIPPGERNYVVADSFYLPVDVHALSVYPHAHFLAREMWLVARFPKGDTRWLLRIDDWDFNWQDEYRYAKPISLPAGSMLVMRYTYDNSDDNPRNPNHPPKRVKYGSYSTDEMADLIVRLLPRSAADTELRRRQDMWKGHADDAVYLAHREHALGDSALDAGDVDRAIAHYREALRYRTDAAVHSALGRALAMQGEVAKAREHLEEAVRLTDRKDPVALDGLAAVYAAAGEMDQAVLVAEEALAIAAGAGAQALADQIRKRLELYRLPPEPQQSGDQPLGPDHAQSVAQHPEKDKQRDRRAEGSTPPHSCHAREEQAHEHEAGRQEPQQEDPDVVAGDPRHVRCARQKARAGAGTARRGRRGPRLGRGPRGAPFRESESCDLDARKRDGEQGDQLGKDPGPDREALSLPRRPREHEQQRDQGEQLLASFSPQEPPPSPRPSAAQRPPPVRP